jgi:hypothetical protein
VSDRFQQSINPYRWELPQPAVPKPPSPPAGQPTSGVEPVPPAGAPGAGAMPVPANPATAPAGPK